MDGFCSAYTTIYLTNLAYSALGTINVLIANSFLADYRATFS
jgi:hypothetical protein